MMQLIKQANAYITGPIHEVIATITSIKKMRQLWTNRFYANSIYLIGSNVLAALLGFVFWVAAARFYPAEDVGLASAAISAIGLLALFSSVGLPEGIIRFLPGSGNDARHILNTALTIILITSTLAGFVFVVGLGFWSPRLLFIQQDMLYAVGFVLLTVIFALSSLVDNIYVAGRRAGFVLARGTVFNVLKLALVIIVASFLGSSGILASWAISLVVAFIIGVLFLVRRVQYAYKPSPVIRKEIVNRLLPFSLANYSSSLLWRGSTMLLPVIVLNVLGAEANAYFFTAWAISTVLTMIPSSISTSLFAEGSNNLKSLSANVIRSLKMIFLLLVPSVIIIFFLAGWLLHIFSSEYAANSATLLRILAIASFPVAVNVIYLNILRVEKRLRAILIVSGFLAVLIVALSYILLPRLGISGAGYAWLISHGSVAAWTITDLVRKLSSARKKI